MSARELGLDAALDQSSVPPTDGSRDGDAADAADAAPQCDPTKTPSQDPCVIDDKLAIFVAPSGADANAGTMAAPVKTFARAIELAKTLPSHRVIACAASYTDAALKLAGPASDYGVSLFGGVTCPASARRGCWPGVEITRLHRPSHPPASGQALIVSSLTKAVVIEATFDAHAGVARGESNIAGLVSDSPGVTLRRVKLTAGPGVQGVDGVLKPVTFPTATDLRGLAAAGNVPGGEKSCTCPALGSSVGGVGGTGGGGGGNAGGGRSTPPVTGGGAGQTVEQCTAGQGRDVSRSGCSRGGRRCRCQGPRHSLFEWVGTFIRGERGAWRAGTGRRRWRWVEPAGAGGGGGCGACGGAEGGAGGGGGASVALALLASPITLESCEVTAGIAGAGGAGAAGELARAWAAMVASRTPTVVALADGAARAAPAAPAGAARAKIRLRPLIRLMFTMVVNRLTERMVFEGAEQKRNRHRLLLLIDEFPVLNRMEIFADALSYMAGYGLKAYLITQDIRQIVDAYGKNESIVSNCHVRIAFAPNQVETAELLSKMTGTQTVQKASYNFSGSRFSPVMGHMNASVDHVERPLMTPDEVLRLKPPKKQSNGDSEKHRRAGADADLRQRPLSDSRHADAVLPRSDLACSS